jgi:hypothetical protein
MVLRDMEVEGVNWNNLAQDMDRWRAVENTVLKLRVQLSAGNFLAS